MSRFFIAAITALLLTSVVAGRDWVSEPRGAGQQSYPPLVKDSPDTRGKAENNWKRMLEAYNLPETPAALYPITYFPKSLKAISGGIRIMPAVNAGDADSMACREAARAFTERWRELIGTDPAGLSLASAAESGATITLIYRQANYPFPVAGDYGTLTMTVTADGRLTDMDDRLIPEVELPSRPSLNRDAMAARVLGRTFTYRDGRGQDQQLTISDKARVEAKQVVVLPVEKNGELALHLAWEVRMDADKTQAWTVYIDAVNGEELEAAR